MTSIARRVVAFLCFSLTGGLALAGPPTVSSIDPPQGFVDEATPVVVHGDGFEHTARLSLLPGGLSGVRPFYELPTRVAVSGGFAFASTSEDRLYVIDLLDPKRPAVVGNLQLPDGTRGIVTSGTTAFLAGYVWSSTDSTSWLAVIDIANPTEPEWIDYVSLPGRACPRGISLFGNHAYVPTLTDGLYVFDVGDPRAVRQVGHAFTGQRMQDIAFDANNGYLLSHTGGMIVLDMADPAAPAAVGGFDAGDLSFPYGVAVSGTHVYLIDYNTGLFVFDAAEPSAPQLVGRFRSSGFGMAVAVTEDRAFLANGVGGLTVLDVSDPSAPVQETHCDTPGFAADVALSGGLAVIADYEGGIQVTDGACAGLYVGVDTDSWDALDVAVSGTNAFVAEGYGGLRILDVSDPTLPLQVGWYPLPDDASAVDVVGTFAYVVDQYGGGLEIVDVSTPSAPVLAGQVSLGAPTDVSVAGSYAYVTGWNWHNSRTWLQTIDVADPAEPRVVGQATLPCFPEGVAAAPPHVYVACGYAGLLVVDVDDPAAPVVVGSLDTTGRAQGVAVSGNLVAIADGEGGVHLVDVRDPASPQLESSYRSSGGLQR